MIFVDLMIFKITLTMAISGLKLFLNLRCSKKKKGKQQQDIQRWHTVIVEILNLIRDITR